MSSLAQLLVVGSALAFHAPATRASIGVRSRARPAIVCDAAWVTSTTGLRYIDETVGEGEGAKKGDIITFHYTSRVMDGEELDGTKGKKPIQFELGKLDVIPGWAEGLEGMREKGTRKLQIPPALWNGASGTAQGVPKDASLEFDFEMVQVYTPTLKERFGTQNLILAALIGLIGVYEAYVVLAGGIPA